jgi:hypothetical protein
MSVDKIRQALQRRPGPQDFREQLFWLVDMIYACKAAQDVRLVERARLLEDALGSLGDFLETGDSAALEQTHTNLEEFARFIQTASHTA